jgi:hypothetical protein
MARTLYQDHRAFRANVDECDRLFEPLLALAIRCCLSLPNASAAPVTPRRFRFAGAPSGKVCSSARRYTDESKE